MKKIFFFLGKGGVGKTTSSASLAYYLAERGEKVYWISVDPAHNLCDVVGCKPFEGAQEIETNLFAEEIDTDKHTEEYIRTNIDRMKEMYRYLEIINLEKTFDILKYSPGMEEAAVMHALIGAIKKYRDSRDYIIVDTPPTGLMLKIFALPFTSSLWMERLGQWRKRILDGRKTVNAIKGEGSRNREPATEKEDDPVLRELGLRISDTDFLKAVFRDTSRTSMILVLNQDGLSLRESVRIKEGLGGLGITIGLALLNKFGMVDETEEHIVEAFRDIDMARLPFIKNTDISKRSLVELAGKWAEKVI